MDGRYNPKNICNNFEPSTSKTDKVLTLNK